MDEDGHLKLNSEGDGKPVEKDGGDMVMFAPPHQDPTALF